MADKKEPQDQPKTVPQDQVQNLVDQYNQLVAEKSTIRHSKRNENASC